MNGLEKFEPGCFYHIVNHAVGKENLFRSKENYRYFLEKYSWYMAPVASTLCYCLMPNHIHFLVKTLDDKSLSEHKKFNGDYHKLIMLHFSNLLNSYAKAYNKRFGRRGALWIDCTKRFKVDSDSYLTAVIKYIHQNPVNHGYTNGIEDWVHNSYRILVSQKPTFLDRKDVMNWFGGRDRFIDFHRNMKPELNEKWEP